jgi:hypothetical protein
MSTLTGFAGSGSVAAVKNSSCRLDEAKAIDSCLMQQLLYAARPVNSTDVI